MPRDGSGNYNRPAGQPVSAGTVIDAAVFNTLTADIATALTGSLPRDGQAPPTADLPMGNFKHTGVANGTARNHYAALGQVQDSTLTYLTSVAGTNTITATGALSLAAYAAGQRFTFIPAVTNTGATTLNVNSIGAKNVYAFGAACVGGELVSGVPTEVVYDGTQFNVMPLGVRPGLEKIGEYTAAAAATLDIETGISSTRYVGYMLDVQYLYPATNATTLKMRIKSGGAYQTSSYSTMLTFSNSSAVPATPVQANSLASDGWELVATNGGSSTAANALSGQILFPNPHEATSYMKAMGDLSYVGSGGGTNKVNVGGYYGTGGGLQGIRFLSSSGNINGKVTLYGLRA